MIKILNNSQNKEKIMNNNNNYKYLRSRKKTHVAESLPKGTWLPVSAIAKLTNKSKQTIRMAYLANKISGIKLSKNGVLLIKYEDVLKLIKKNS